MVVSVWPPPPVLRRTAFLFFPETVYSRQETAGSLGQEKGDSGRQETGDRRQEEEKEKVGPPAPTRKKSGPQADTAINEHTPYGSGMTVYFES